MKKLSLLLAVLFIGIANLNAQTNATNIAAVEIEELKEVKTCTKTGKICDETCEKKKNATCCKGKSTSKCSKTKTKKSDGEAHAAMIESTITEALGTEINKVKVEKTACSKSAKKGCCKKDAKNKTEQVSSNK